MTLYTDWQADAAPVWLQRPSGRAWNETGGLLKDVVVDAARVATQAAFPLSAPADALSFLGRERSLPRVPADTDETHRETLRDAWELWPFGGTAPGVIAAVERRWPGAVPTILTYWQDPSYFGVDDSSWAQWALFLTLSTWGVAPVWGTAIKWGQPSLTWGISAPAGEVAELKDIIRTWGAGYAVCTKVVVTTPAGPIEIMP